ncbi:MAG: aldo/keto reductase [Cyanobium sp.]
MLYLGWSYSACSPGLLSGRVSEQGLPEGDWRATTPRFQGDDFAANVALAREIQALVLAKGCTPAQLALAWVLSRGSNILALTGTTKLTHLKDNLGACAVALSAEEQASLDGFAPRVLGDRYDSWGMAGING